MHAGGKIAAVGGFDEAEREPEDVEAEIRERTLALFRRPLHARVGNHADQRFGRREDAIETDGASLTSGL